jgi:hypothetical protein
MVPASLVDGDEQDKKAGRGELLPQLASPAAERRLARLRLKLAKTGAPRLRQRSRGAGVRQLVAALYVALVEK